MNVSRSNNSTLGDEWLGKLFVNLHQCATHLELSLYPTAVLDAITSCLILLGRHIRIPAYIILLRKEYIFCLHFVFYFFAYDSFHQNSFKQSKVIFCYLIMHFLCV